VKDYPLTIRHASGQITDVLYNASVYKDDKGKVLGVFAAARDVTARRKVEEQLHTTSAYARSLIEASLDPLVTISPEGKVTDVNEATVKVTGVSREKLIGSDFSDYFTEPEEAREGYERVFKEGFVTDYPLSIRNAFGQITDVLYNASVYKDDKGKVLGVFAAARDATQVKQKNEFSAMVTHELKTPLAPILGYCKMLKTLMLGTLNEEQIKAIEVIKNNALNLQDLINDIMDVHKLEINRIKFQMEDVSLDEFFDNLNSNYEPILRDKGIKFITKLSTKGVVIRTDKSRLRQVVDNLIDNSIKFGCGDDKMIEIAAKNDRDNLIIYVKDNGIGIPIEKQKNLFKKFYQIDTSARRPSGGTGLGLAISKGIIENLGGSIWMESDGKTGTTFYFKLTLGDSPI
jgi:PAS domain S-box-containing protein